MLLPSLNSSYSLAMLESEMVFLPLRRAFEFWLILFTQLYISVSIIQVGYDAFAYYLNLSLAMRKNKSFKDENSFKGRCHQSRQISIQLQASILNRAKEGKSQNENRDKQSHNQNRTLNDWQSNSSISNNILKQIMSYSNLPSLNESKCSSRAKNTSSTIAVFQKYNKGAQASFSNRNPSSMASNANSRRNSKRLVIDQQNSSKLIESNRLIESIKPLSTISNFKEINRKNQSKTSHTITNQIQNIRSTYDTQQNLYETQQYETHQNLYGMPEDMSYKRYNELLKLKEAYAIRIDEIQIQEECFAKEFSEVIEFWEEMIEYEHSIARYEQEILKLAELLRENDDKLKEHQTQLFEVNRDYISSKRLLQYKSNGYREKTLNDVERVHEELIKKLTIKNFEEIVLFNIKVVIPAQIQKDSISQVYEQLFRNRCTKKYTMILKKHTNQMDLYDSRILSEYIKKVMDLEAQYLRSDLEGAGSQPNSNSNCESDGYFLEVERIIELIQADKLRENELQSSMQMVKTDLQSCREVIREDQQKIASAIDEINEQIQSDYHSLTEQSADFNGLLQQKYSQKYLEFKSLREEKANILRQAVANSQQIQPMNKMLFH